MLDVVTELHQGFTVTGDSEERTSAGGASSRRRWFRVETALAVAGVMIAVGFVLPWFESTPGAGRDSGLEFALDGGIWMALLAIPALGALSAVLGVLGWRASRYAGLAAVITVLIAGAFVLASAWPWLYTIPVIAGIALIALGVLKRGLRATPLLGVALLGAIAVSVWLLGRDPLLPDSEHAGSLFLLLLSVAAALAGLGLIVTGLRKRGRPRALVIAGSSLALFGAYAAALDVFGAALANSSIGAWMTGVGVLSMLAILLTTRAKASAIAATDKTAAANNEAPAEKPSQAKKVKKTKKKADAKTTEKPSQSKKPKKSKDKAEVEKDAAAESSAEAEKAEKAEKAAKIEKLKRLKKLKLLRAKELAAAKEAKDAEEEDKATAKAGEALANEPEPVFASDPSAAPPPKDEDRDALMKRVGVKKPPPPSDSELEAMLAALKSRTSDDD